VSSAAGTVKNIWVRGVDGGMTCSWVWAWWGWGVDECGCECV